MGLINIQEALWCLTGNNPQEERPDSAWNSSSNRGQLVMNTSATIVAEGNFLKDLFLRMSFQEFN
jgi:hypothetical protein